jgi:hypothetical protein
MQQHASKHSDGQKHIHSNSSIVGIKSSYSVAESKANGKTILGIYDNRIDR